MSNFWDFSVWGGLNLMALLLLSLLLANWLKKSIKFLRMSLIPTSVLGGVILLAIAGIYDIFSATPLFETAFFGGNGYDNLEIITYHTLALGFIASSLKSSKGKLTKQRSIEIFNTGVTTVSTYLIQGVLGMAITIVAAMVIKDFFPAAGILLPFGYGQGTGQAMNYGTIYETTNGFVGGKSFGLTIAALGFLSASIGGVIHLNILKKRGTIVLDGSEDGDNLKSDEIQSKNEIPMQGSMDKMTVQVGIVVLSYFITFLLMFLLVVFFRE